MDNVVPLAEAYRKKVLQQLSDDDLLFLVQLSERLRTQERLATAKPIVIRLQQQRNYVAPAGFVSKEKFIDSDGNTYDSRDEYKRQLIDEGYEPDVATDMAHALEQYGLHEVWEDENWFLTHHGYQLHMDQNAHNVNRKPNRTYVDHAFRNPELAKLLEIIEKIQD